MLTHKDIDKVGQTLYEVSFTLFEHKDDEGYVDWDRFRCPDVLPGYYKTVEEAKAAVETGIGWRTPDVFWMANIYSVTFEQNYVFDRELGDIMDVDRTQSDDWLWEARWVGTELEWDTP